MRAEIVFSVPACLLFTAVATSSVILTVCTLLVILHCRANDVLAEETAPRTSAVAAGAFMRGSQLDAATGSHSDDDVDEKPSLSAATLAALQAVLAERATTADDPFSVEDWNLSQFHYTEATAASLAAQVATLGGRCACVSCPTLFAALRDAGHDCHLFEFDEKYAARGCFSLYDYNEPLSLAPEHLGAFDVVVADPPFLAEECLTKTASTIRALARHADAPVLLLTGAVMRGCALRELRARPCVWQPEHKSKLGNDFLCYATWPAELLGGWAPEEADEEGREAAAH